MVHKGVVYDTNLMTFGETNYLYNLTSYGGSRILRNFHAFLLTVKAQVRSQTPPRDIGGAEYFACLLSES